MTVRVKTVIRDVAAAFGVPAVAILSATRRRRITHARHVVMGVLAEGVLAPFEISTVRIGRWLGGRDRATVLHGRNAYRGWCAALGLDPLADAASLVERAERIAVLLGYPGKSEPTEMPTDVPPPLRLGRQNFHDDETHEESPPMSAALSCTPAPIWRGTIFGEFALSRTDFTALPPAMQAEGLRLAVEKLREEDGVTTAAAALTVGQAVGVSSKLVLDMLAGEPPPHRMPDEDAVRRRALDADGVIAADRPEAADAGFQRFAAARLRLRKAGTLDVPAAYAAYLQFLRAEPFDPLPRTNFGAACRALGGGVRRGDVLSGVVMIGAGT